jgi:hypothetical protein
MRDVAAIDAVLQHQIENPTGQLLTAEGHAVCQQPQLAPDSRGISTEVSSCYAISHS